MDAETPERFGPDVLPVGVLVEDSVEGKTEVAGLAGRSAGSHSLGHDDRLGRGSGGRSRATARHGSVDARVGDVEGRAHAHKGPDVALKLDNAVVQRAADRVPAVAVGLEVRIGERQRRAGFASLGLGRRGAFFGRGRDRRPPGQERER